VTSPPRLGRAGGSAGAPAPVRLVHLGLGNFFRAHQARYTDLAPDADEWGIAAFGGRAAQGAQLAERMAEQDGLYTLVTRGPVADRFDVVASVSRAYAGTDHDEWLRRLSSPNTACVTITVTEFGYRRAAGGDLDSDAIEVQQDIAALRADLRNPVLTMPARLVAGLVARRRSDAGPIAIVSCDNLPGNGLATQRVVTQFAERIDPRLREWIEANITFPATMVDRITPQAGTDLRAVVESATGIRDECPVVTEPFSEWVVSGPFPAGRPDWERSGVTFADGADGVEAHERRKLLLLNGAHSMLAYTGSNLGLLTVADAIDDSRCRELVRLWWAESWPQVGLPEGGLHDYCDQLLERWANPRIAHLLSQIAADGSQKLPVRVIPVLRARRATGAAAPASLAIIAGWVRYLRRVGPSVHDAGLSQSPLTVDGPPLAVARAVIGRLSGNDPELLADDESIVALAAEIT
jgi:fructuronate reductase